MEQDCPVVVSAIITAATTLLGNTTSRSSGTAVGFECVPGYSLQGASVLRCTTSGTWDHDTPTCTATSRTFNGWRLNLTQVDFIVLGVCCALVLFLLVLAIVVCCLYRRKTPSGGATSKQRPLRRRRRRRTSSCTSLSSESDLPLWNTQLGPWHGLRRYPTQTHRSWAGVMPTYYPSYVTNYPLTSQHAASADYPMTYFHWHPVPEGRRQPMYRDTSDPFRPLDAGIRTPFSSSHPSRLTQHYPQQSTYNPFRYETGKTGWHNGFEYNRSGIPRAQVRPSHVAHSDLSLDQTLFEDDVSPRKRAAREKKAEAERKL